MSDVVIIQKFTDLVAWQEGHRLVIMVYKLTKTFPTDELFGLVSQMRRSAVSITSNIAEGFSRQSYKEKAQFYAIALGSTTELQNQLLISKDVGLLPQEKFKECADKSVHVHKIINGLIKHSRNLTA